MAEVTEALDRYEADTAVRGVEHFVDYLSNWYVRRSRRRFWKSGVVNPPEGDADEDKLTAYATLYECLVTLVRLLAPCVPFVTESLYQNLVRSTGGASLSVHLESWPQADVSRTDERLAEATRLAMRLSSLGRAARSKAGIKVRQPLQGALVKLRMPEEAGLMAEVAHQVRDELNLRDLEALQDESKVLEYAVQPNLPASGTEVRRRRGKDQRRTVRRRPEGGLPPGGGEKRRGDRGLHPGPGGGAHHSLGQGRVLGGQ